MITAALLVFTLKVVAVRFLDQTLDFNLEPMEILQDLILALQVIFILHLMEIHKQVALNILRLVV